MPTSGTQNPDPHQCCETAPAADLARCPQSGRAGPPVAWTTVAALVRGPIPARRPFRLCTDPDCDTVYYDGSTRYGTEDLHLRPGFKRGGGGLLCYCFLYSEDDVARQLGQTGATDIVEAIRAEVEAGNCACEVRNPTGKCCLGDVKRRVRELEAGGDPR